MTPAATKPPLTRPQVEALASKLKALERGACCCRGAGRCAACQSWDVRFRLGDLLAVNIAARREQ